ncbi:hypothetical protein C4O30_08290 [Lactiplantibacillus plantarum]|uniref:hypothetical protein n=1 Tax=Lactiplantibacillus plantarum TaxID=1590 RepID=UPI000CE96ADA|nr:hypothetical protein [Lactiplantibacillus plantarum]AVE82977.1 hypothetical protein C4O30_08290 [Lactiplantibacillus plantarum]
MTIRISLTDFLTFNASKSQRSKRNVVKRIQDRHDYNPAFDFWKDLREAVKKLPDNPNLSALDSIAASEPDNKQHKRENYTRAVARFKSFVKHESPEFFSVQNIKNIWSMENQLEVNVSPEIGMRINDTEYLVKIYFKVKSPNISISKQNVSSTLAMLRTALDASGEKRPCAILNIQTGKLITEDQSDIEDDEMDLEVEALTFVNTWNRIVPPDHS